MAEPYNPNFPVPKGYAQVTVTSTPQTITQLLVAAGWAFQTIPSGTRGVTMQPETVVRWRDDGGTPSSTVGMKIAVDQAWIYGGNVALITLVTATTAVLNLYFEG